MKEIFKPIKGFPGYYVSTFGNVLSMKQRHQHTLKQQSNADGYLYVQLYRDGKNYPVYVHSLVAVTFIGKRPRKDYDVDHINGKRDDNRLENLQWLQTQQNVEKARARKTICVETGKTYDSATKASRAIGLSDRAVHYAIYNGTRAGGYHWKYITE